MQVFQLVIKNEVGVELETPSFETFSKMYTRKVYEEKECGNIALINIFDSVEVV